MPSTCASIYSQLCVLQSMLASRNGFQGTLADIALISLRPNAGVAPTYLSRSLKSSGGVFVAQQDGSSRGTHRF